MRARKELSLTTGVCRLALLCLIYFLSFAPAAQLFASCPVGEGENGAGRSAFDLMEAEVHEAGIINRMPIFFVENRGQVHPGIQYYEQSRRHTTGFTREGLVLDLPGSVGEGRSRSTVALKPLGMAAQVAIIGEQPLTGRVNYFLGRDEHRWRTQLPTYGAIVFREAYPGIDLRFYGSRGELEYDIVVKEGSDFSQVRFAYEGIAGLSRTEQGDMEVRLQGGQRLVQRKPTVYQMIDGDRRVLDGHFRIDEVPVGPADEILRDSGEQRGGQSGRGVYGFEVASYNPGFPIVIDPVLVYSTYLGGGGEDYGYGIARDQGGNIYITGETTSLDFRLEKPMQGSYGGGNGDAFVMKLDATDLKLLYATYLGGGERDRGRALAVSKLGSVFVTGFTYSSDFPTANALQKTLAGAGEAFIAKLNPTGSMLVYSTYLGGSGDDLAGDIAVDGSERVTVVGSTGSPDFPLMQPLQSKLSGDTDVFVARLRADGAALIYSTYLGGAGSDIGRGLAIDTQGRAYVTGYTHSTDFPMNNPIQAHYGGGAGDGFVTVFEPAGQSLRFSTYLGGKGHDSGWGIAVDDNGSAMVAGDTGSSDFPVAGGYRTSFGGGTMDAFLLKLDTVAPALVFSAYFGGANADYGRSVALGPDGSIYMTGGTNSPNFPLEKSIQPWSGGGFGDVFVLRFDATGTGLYYSTFLGGHDWEWGSDMVVDPEGNAYVTGSTASADFPIKGSGQPYLQGEVDVFLAKIDSLTTYLITAKQGLHGVISPPGSVKVERGLDQHFKITPDPGYRVKELLVDGKAIEPATEYTFTNVTKDHSIKATFGLIVYNIAATAGQHGGIIPSGNVPVNHGAAKTFRMKPDEHYLVSEVLVDGVSQGKLPSYKFPSVKSNHAIHVNFVIEQHTIWAEAGNYGTISPEGLSRVDHGGNQTIVMTPDKDCHVVDVWVDDVSKGPLKEYTFENVAQNHKIVARFAIDTHTISASAGSHGTVTPSGSVLVNHGAGKTFWIKADEGYVTADVVVDGESKGPRGRWDFVNVTSDHSIQAAFNPR